jgi:ABC-2 type transport system permease protein
MTDRTVAPASTVSTVTAPTSSRPAPHDYEPPGRLRQIAMMVWRNLKHIKRQPEMLTDVTIQPVMFVLLFAFVFGGSIQTDSGSYREWLLPGIMAQTMAFASFIVAIGLNMDLGKGIIDRFRSLPIARSSVLVGRSIYSLIHSSIGIFVMSVTGLAIGWRIRGSVGEALLAFGLLLLFGFAMIWIGVLVGSSMRSPEAVNGLMFTTIFPVTFLANTFAPTEGMVPWLRTVAEWNPISSLVQAMRELWGNVPPAPADAALPLQHPVLTTVIWSVLITGVVAPLAVRAFVRRTTD